MAYIVKVGDKTYKVEVMRVGDKFKILLDNNELNVDVAKISSSQLSLIVNNKPYNIIIENNTNILVQGELFNVEVVDERLQSLTKAKKETKKAEAKLIAPMPGLIVSIEVKEGDFVQEGTGIIIVEAMKMQNEMKSPKDGIVKKILVKEGTTVNSGDTLAIIE